MVSGNAIASMGVLVAIEADSNPTKPAEVSVMEQLPRFQKALFSAFAEVTGAHFIIQTEVYELNIKITNEELEAFTPTLLVEASWEERASLRLGSCCGKPVFWSNHQSGFVLVVGDDDEIWGIGVLLPKEAAQAIPTELDKARKSSRGDVSTKKLQPKTCN